MAVSTGRHGRHGRHGRQTIREDVKEYLLDAILAGKLSAGDRIVETRVARQLGVSQGPVREALRDLEFLGFVESAPFRGSRVRIFSYEEILQVYPVRAAIEGVAAHAAASASESELMDRLHEHYQEMCSATEQGDGGAHAEADIAFHRAIVDASGNRFLSLSWDSMRLATTTFMSAILTQRDLQELTQRHLPILTALEAHDPIAAERAARWHIEELREWILESSLIEQHGEGASPYDDVKKAGECIGPKNG